ncbi:hypothetical protein R1sor_019785 [Riccia sorocarpa]|uniref:Uncharacterized protein n=1 Tax=Riccia sorocarpa TaxID=122646 RepID=A0ABD3IDM2_9MARC
MIRRHIEEESYEAFGVPGMQWITIPMKSKYRGMSKVMRNIFAAWEKNKRWIEAESIHTLEDWRRIQLWGSAQEARDGRLRKADSQTKKLLWEDGYRTLGDLLIEGSEDKAGWEQRRYAWREQANVHRAYDKLTEQITGPSAARRQGEEKIGSATNSKRKKARCENRAVEDVMHTFWSCPQAEEIWNHVRRFFALNQDPTERWLPRCNHCVLAERLPGRFEECAERWEALRGATIWAIWLARNAKSFSGENGTGERWTAFSGTGSQYTSKSNGRRTRNDGRTSAKSSLGAGRSRRQGSSSKRTAHSISRDKRHDDD